ncbi:MAG: PAS-domain containing protein [Hyphomicrobiaceae bacterium]|nr:PAS-domain containing protein [Hyphomicrobiaceae bacterium]
MMPVDLAAAAAATLADLVQERRRLSLLLSGLDLIDQGITVMDGELKLVAASRGLFKLFRSAPEMWRVGTPFADFVRYNAQRGEYGEGDVEEIVAKHVSLARQFHPQDMEHVRPDGTIIAIRSSPLPNGGCVTTYTDVTQQRAHARLVRARSEELDRRVHERTAELEAVNAEQKRLEAVLVHAQKMEAVGQLTGGLAHDFNNLLTIVISNLAVMRDHAAKAGIMEFVEPALVAAHKGAAITRRLLAFARRQRLEPRIVEVNSLIANLLSLSRHSLPSTISISKQPAPFELHTRVDPEQLEHAFLNLVLNARDAMPGGGSLVVHSASRLVHNAEAAELELAPGRYVEIRVEDTGKGMDETTLLRVFEPFFTSKPFGAGSGLGLSVVYGFVKQSGGAVHISSAPGRGTTVTLLLPASPAPTRPDVHQSLGARQSAGSSRLVLLVEDDADVRTVIRRQLTDIGHMVIEARAGDEALAIIDDVPELSVLVSDIVMPGDIDGRRLAHLAKQKRPGLRVVLVTGYADGLDVGGGRYRSFTVLRKPCTKDELAAAIETAPQ